MAELDKIQIVQIELLRYELKKQSEQLDLMFKNIIAIQDKLGYMAQLIDENLKYVPKPIKQADILSLANNGLD